MDHGGGGGFGGGHGGFGGGHGGFGGGHGGFGGGHGGFGGGHGGPGGFGFGGPGFGGPGFGGPGFGGPGGIFGPGCPGPGFLGPGPFAPRGGPLFAPWLDALAVTAVAAAVVAPYRGYNDGRHRRGMIVWTEDGREVSSAVNLITVRLCQAQNLKKVQMLGKQDPYVRAKIYYDGHQIGECRSSTSRDGGKDPIWQNMSKSVFTFYVPATVTLDRLTLALDVINENLIADGFIGTTGSIPLEQAADGRDKWWNVSTGGSLQAIVEVVTNDNPGTTPNNAYARSSNSNNGRSRNPRIPVVSATPAQATAPGAYGAPPAAASVGTGYAPRPSASTSEPQPVYTANATYSSTQYRPPPVAPGAAAGGGGGGASYSRTTNSSRSSSDLPDKGYAYNGAPAAVPEARAVPLYDGNPSAAYGASGSGAYPAVPAYPVASTTSSQHQQQQPYAPATSSQHHQQQPYAPTTSSQHHQQQPYAPATSSQQQRYSQQQSNQYPQQQPNQYGYSSSRYSS